ncbi:ankyrin repeat-containing domain protein [Xylariaceae sp. FL1272]|nr:ankyrin repeat-containing domain protein [Xylariaceae sp. FL1272]
MNAGADVNAVGKFLATPLHLAADPMIARELIQRGATMNSRDVTGDTPLMRAVQQDNFELFKDLLSWGANPMLLNLNGDSALHFTTFEYRTSLQSRRPKVFAELMKLGLNIHRPNKDGVSAFHLAVSKSTPSLLPILLNSNARMEDSKPLPWHVRSIQLFVYPSFKLIRRKYGQERLTDFVNLEPTGIRSPLCLAAYVGNTFAMKNILDLGASIDFEGCASGSALMAACEAGRLEHVKFLVRHQAKLTYWSKGGFRSAFEAANQCNSVLKWLLVDRFIDQRKLCPSNGDIEPMNDHAKPWSGMTKTEFVINDDMERRSNEPVKEYWIRLVRIKIDLRGKVLPLCSGRRTSQRSRLIPLEKVRIHPGGYNAPRETNAMAR